MSGRRTLILIALLLSALYCVRVLILPHARTREGATASASGGQPLPPIATTGRVWTRE
ncbi:hypothetical protein [Reyranella sp.]|uniref:hypothetical protein n=1 Tax=Reyranella sp. TaxID=1929291 RepID=UPI003BABCBE4